MKGPRLLLAIIIVVGLMCGAMLVLADPPARLIVRWTARTSLVLFSLVYLARPAVQLWPAPWSKWLLAQRKWVGLGFAASHTYHLAGILGIGWPDVGGFFAQTPPNPLGVASYVFLTAMSVTSIDRVRRAMSRRWWNGIHLVGVHLAWIVFAGSYAKRLAGAPLNVIPLGFLVLIAGVRATAWVRHWQRKRARAEVTDRTTSPAAPGAR